MIDRRDYKALKSRKVPEILLPDGYILKIDEHDKIYISRGGKKKYYLTDRFVNYLCDKKPVNHNMLLFLRMLQGMSAIANRLGKESITRIKIEALIREIQSKYE